MSESVADRVTLYRRLGGHEVLVVVVDLFTRHLAADNELARFIRHLDQERLRQHQVAFFAELFGGPPRYHGRSLRAIHRGLGITARHFTLVSAHFAAALGACDLPDDLCAELLDLLAALRPEIIGTAQID